jgi:uncharacterized phage infection (PIP) family protein YhgE
MARTGITEAQVRAAVAALQARGEKVTPSSVRHELGDTGSFGTINGYLKVIKEEQAKEPEPHPQPVPESVQALFQRAWSLAQATAQAELASEREAVQSELTDLQAKFDEVVMDRDEAIRVVERERDHAEESTTSLAAQLKEERERTIAQAERIGQLTAQFEVLEAERQMAWKERDELDTANKKLTKELSRLADDLVSHRDQLKDQAAELTKLKGKKP